MKNPFDLTVKASRLLRKGHPLQAALALHQLLLPTSKAKRKRAAAKPKQAKPALARTKAPQTRPIRPAPETFINGRFDSGHGVIGYKLYTPRGSVQRRMPLVVMLHGCRQSAADFAAGTGMNGLADELGFLVLYPEQSASANLHRCWNWHRPGDQRRGRGEPAAIAALTHHAILACRANPARVYIAGMSAGGTAAAIMGIAYPEIYASIGVHSAVANGKVSTLAGALSAMRTGRAGNIADKSARTPPTVIFHGDGDKIVHPDNADGFLGGFQTKRSKPTVGQTCKGRSDGGRDFTRTIYRSATGEVVLESWTIHGGGHAWSGGSRAGSYTDPAGPDASREIMRFFMAHPMKPVRRSE